MLRPLTRPYLFTWVISHKSNNCPSIYRHSHCVSQRWINKVEFRRIFLWVEVPETLCNNVEIVPMKKDRVVLRSDNASILQHNLHPRPKLQLVCLCPGNRLPQRTTHVAGVIKLHRRLPRKISGEHSRDSEVVSLQDGHVVRENERHVVHARSEPRPINGSLICKVGTKFAIIQNLLQTT